MSELDSDLGRKVVLVLWWQFVGTVLLEVVRLVNDKLLWSACMRATHAAHHWRRLTRWRAQGTFGTRGYEKPGSTTMWSWYDVCSAHNRQVDCALTPNGACCCDQVNHASFAVGFAEAGSYIAPGTCLVTSVGEVTPPPSCECSLPDMVIMGTVSGPPGVWWQDWVNVVVFFTLGPIAFLLFAYVVCIQKPGRFAGPV